MMQNIKKCLAVILAITMIFGLAACGGSSKKSDFPKRAITLIIPAKPGGDTDTYGRIFATALEKELGVTINVQNYDASNVAMNDCKNADPDGYTLVFFHTAFLVSMLTGSTELNLFNDYDIVGVPVIDATSCVVFNGHRWKNLDEFMASVKAGEKIIGTCQQGSTGHLATAMAMKAIGCDWTQVESTSQADRYADMLADRVDVLYCQYGLISQYLETGDFINIGIMSEERNPFFPDQPTFKELGYDNCSLLKPYFIAAPKGTDEKAVAVLSAALEKACAQTEVKDALAGFSCVPEYYNVQDSVKVLKDTYDNYAQFQDVLKGK